MDTPNSVAPSGAQSRPPIFVFIHGFLDGAIVEDEVVAALGERAADAVCVNFPA